MNQHRAILLLQDVPPHFDDVVRANSNEMSIEGGVMQSTKRQAIGNGGDAPWIGIGQDVRSLKELVASQPTDGAVVMIRAYDPLAKLALMKALPKNSSHISTPDICFLRVGRC